MRTFTKADPKQERRKHRIQTREKAGVGNFGEKYSYLLCSCSDTKNQPGDEHPLPLTLGDLMSFGDKWNQNHTCQHKADAVEQIGNMILTRNTLRDKGSTPDDGNHEKK